MLTLTGDLAANEEYQLGISLVCEI